MRSSLQGRGAKCSGGLRGRLPDVGGSRGRGSSSDCRARLHSVPPHCRGSPGAPPRATPTATSGRQHHRPGRCDNVPTPGAGTQWNVLLTALEAGRPRSRCQQAVLGSEETRPSFLAPRNAAGRRALSPVLVRRQGGGTTLGVKAADPVHTQHSAVPETRRPAGGVRLTGALSSTGDTSSFSESPR